MSSLARPSGLLTVCTFCEHLTPWCRDFPLGHVVCCDTAMSQTAKVGSSKGPCALQGMAIVRLLKQIEQRTQRRIYELFDLICGTSTGGILAVAIALKQMTLGQCEDIYRWGQGSDLPPEACPKARAHL